MARGLVLITGASGHVGFRVLVTTLATGYRVRATVRKPEQIDTITATKSIKPYLDNLEFVVVPDILKDGAYGEALKDVTYVLHVASSLAQETDDPERDIVDPAIKGTVNMLEGAHKVSSIKRIVVISSIVTITGGRPSFEGRVFNEKDLIPRPTWPYGSGFEAYIASKALALYATLDWLKANKPSFDVINIQPSFVIRPNELTTSVDAMVAGSNSNALRPILGQKCDAPVTFFTVHLDDVADAHVKALDPSVKGGQHFIVSVPKQTGSWNEGIKAAKRLFLEAEGKLPLDGNLPSKPIAIDSSKAERELGIQFKSFEEQIKDLVGYVLEVSELSVKLEYWNNHSINLDIEFNTPAYISQFSSQPKP